MFLGVGYIPNKETGNKRLFDRKDIISVSLMAVRANDPPDDTVGSRLENRET